MNGPLFKLTYPGSKLKYSNNGCPNGGGRLPAYEATRVDTGVSSDLSLVMISDTNTHHHDRSHATQGLAGVGELYDIADQYYAGLKWHVNRISGFKIQRKRVGP